MCATCRNLLYAIALMVFSTTGSADQASETSSPLNVEMTTWRVTQHGVATLPAATALPGDVLRYQVSYANISDGTLRNIQATVPVPESTILNAVSSERRLFASTDQKKYFSRWPLTRKIKRPDGVEVEEPIPLSEVRSLRWDVPTILANSTVIFYIDVTVVK